MGPRPDATAAKLLSTGQKALAIVAAIGIAAGAALRPRATAVIVLGCLVAFYLLFALFKVVVTTAGRGHRMPPSADLQSTRKLPHYGVLLPVHDEANMLKRLVARVSQLNYPRERLHIYILIEQDDADTLAAAKTLGLRFHGDGQHPRGPLRHVVVVVIPPGGPKTKPNAMNVAFPLVVADGCRYVTIYDAEDRPDPDQLLLSVATFKAAGPELVCLQAELVFWNDDTNWVSALYWVGYKIHFRRFLPGLARLGLPVPLGGTSNHFTVSALLEVALPGDLVWDPHNLTEDADLGARLAAAGYRVDLLASTTMEEAPISARVVDKQQRRWKGGYLQTALVHGRRPLRSARQMGPFRWASLLLMTFGTPLTFLINPLFLALSIGYFATGSPLITSLFPAPVYYTATVLLVIGNFGITFELVQTTMNEAHRTRGRFGLLKYMFLAQVMWLWMSWSTYVAAFEMITGKRGWHKTPHGHAETDEPEPNWPLPVTVVPEPVQFALVPRPRQPAGNARSTPRRVIDNEQTQLLPTIKNRRQTAAEDAQTVILSLTPDKP